MAHLTPSSRPETSVTPGKTLGRTLVPRRPGVAVRPPQHRLSLAFPGATERFPAAPKGQDWPRQRGRAAANMYRGCRHRAAAGRVDLPGHPGRRAFDAVVDKCRPDTAASTRPKTILSGGGEELLELTRTNLREVDGGVGQQPEQAHLGNPAKAGSSACPPNQSAPRGPAGPPRRRPSRPRRWPRRRSRPGSGACRSSPAAWWEERWSWSFSSS
jgi:hypothetical protein